MKDILQKLLNNNPFIEAHLNPPVEPDDLDSFIHKNYGKIDSTIYEDLSSLYTWHNGTDLKDAKIQSATYYLFDVGSLMSLDSVEDFLKNDTFYQVVSNHCMPFVETGAGEYLAYNFKSNDKRILYMSTWNGDLKAYETMFDSFDKMLSSMIEAFDKGIVYIDKENFWVQDFDRYYSFFKAHNPNSSYWQKIL